MAKIKRDAPCPCGSGKKYKKCCLSHNTPSQKTGHTNFIPVYTDLDLLSNSVIKLIKKKKLDKAEAAGYRLLNEYPDQIDGFDRLGMVFEARGKNQKAAEFYLKAAEFAKQNEGFDPQTVQSFIQKAEQLKKEV